MSETAYARRIAALSGELGIPPNYDSARRLDLQPEASELVSIGLSPEGREIRLAPTAADAWGRMAAAAAGEGVKILPLSGFRSVERQTEIIRDKLARGQPISEILRTSAAPGYSEHHTGRAIDIGAPGEVPLVETFAETAAFKWLQRRASAFGFRLSYPRNNRHQIAYEPWHWCYFV